MGERQADITLQPEIPEPRPAHKGELQPDLFHKGIAAPVENIVAITPEECHVITRLGKEAVAPHIVTTGILRCAGNNSSSITHYTNNQKTEPKQTYSLVLGSVEPYAAEYRESFKLANGRTDMARVTALHDATETLEHPLLDIIGSTRRHVGDHAIDSGRIARLILQAELPDRLQ
ncbi:MAG TPA: hypothetical protein VK983_00765 [Candidatus Limnocylindrales bacterium]|nr:hypothetical protein [Candidatus Limnocylindrales bacterium]